MLFNLNKPARFILTPEGEKVIRDHDAQLTKRLRDVTGTNFDWFQYHQQLDDQGTREDQLWRLFEIFGPRMYMGTPPYFVGNNLEFLEDAE